jgi:hypothetical protein
MAELSPEDRYQLRKLQLDVDKKALEVQKAQQELDRFVLELEHKYGLMDQEQAIDPRTATIKETLPVRNGKARTGALLTPELGEADADT